MKKLFAATISTLVLLPGGALAQDFNFGPGDLATSPIPASDWTTFYSGYHGSAAAGRLLIDPGAIGLDGSGMSAGVHLGMRQQFDMFTLGVQTDLGMANVSTEIGDPGSLRGQLNAYGSTTVRAGVVAADPLLIYALGGVAYAHSSGNYEGERVSNWHLGWTAGLGAEVSVSKDVGLFAEYAYAAFAPESYSFPGSVTVDADYDLHMLRAGFNLKF